MCVHREVNVPPQIYCVDRTVGIPNEFSPRCHPMYKHVIYLSSLLLCLLLLFSCPPLHLPLACLSLLVPLTLTCFAPSLLPPPPFSLVHLPLLPLPTSILSHLPLLSLSPPVDEIFMAIHTGSVGAAAAVGATGVNAFKDFRPLSFQSEGERESERGRWWGRRRGSRWKAEKGGMKKEKSR